MRKIDNLQEEQFKKDRWQPQLALLLVFIFCFVVLYWYSPRGFWSHQVNRIIRKFTNISGQNSTPIMEKTPNLWNIEEIMNKEEIFLTTLEAYGIPHPLDSPEMQAERLFNEMIEGLEVDQGIRKVECVACFGRTADNREIFKMNAAPVAWDVKLARDLIANRPQFVRDQMPQRVFDLDDADIMGLNWKSGIRPPAGPHGFWSYTPDEAHLAHIPADKVKVPPIFAPLPSYRGIAEAASLVMIDGTHRTTIRLRAGETEIEFEELNDDESLTSAYSGELLTRHIRKVTMEFLSEKATDAQKKIVYAAMRSAQAPLGMNAIFVSDAFTEVKDHRARGWEDEKSED